MATNPPRRNLPPDSEEWGRWIEKRLQELASTSTEVRTNTRALSQNSAAIVARVAEEHNAIAESNDRSAELNERLEWLNNELENVGVGIITSENAPTPADAEGRPDGAYWTQIDSAGEQIARWRLDDGVWVSAPLGMTFIPEIGASKIIADQAGFRTAVVEDLAASTILSDEMFSRNINITGELTALSDDFTTIVSQAGVQMFANSSLEHEETLPTIPGDRFEVSDMAIQGNVMYVLTSAEWGNQNQIRRYNMSTGALIGTTTSASGWRWSRIAVNDSNLICTARQLPGTGDNDWRMEIRSLTGALQSSFVTIENPSQGLQGTASAVAVGSDGVIAVSYADPLDHTHFIRTYSTSGTVLSNTEPLPAGGGSSLTVAISADYLYHDIPRPSPSAPRALRQYTRAGDYVRDVSLPAAPSKALVKGNTLWVTIQERRNLVVGYDIDSGAPVFVGRPSMESDVPGFGHNFAWSQDLTELRVMRSAFGPSGSNVIIDRYSVSEEPNVRVSIDNFEGRLIAQETHVDSLLVRNVQPLPPAASVNFLGGGLSVGGERVFPGGAVLLDEVSLSGSTSSSNKTDLIIPSGLRGQFSRYELHIYAGESGFSGSVRPLCVCVNDDTGANYRVAASWSGGSSGTFSNNATGFPRTAYIHSQHGYAVISLIPRSLGNTTFVNWTATGYWNAGASDGGTFQSGGRWMGTSQALSHFGIYANAANSWLAESRAELWGYYG